MSLLFNANVIITFKCYVYFECSVNCNLMSAVNIKHFVPGFIPELRKNRTFIRSVSLHCKVH